MKDYISILHSSIKTTEAEKVVNVLVYFNST